MNFRELYAEYKDRVYNLVLQYVHNRQDAEEVCQDVFVKLHEKLGSFRQESSLKTWVYRIAVHTALDFCKARQRHKRRFLLSALRLGSTEKIPDIPHFDHPGARLEEKEALAFLFACIHRLNEKQRTVIILLKIEELSQQETAEVMKLSPKAVESLFQRAKAALEKIIHETKEKEKNIV